MAVVMAGGLSGCSGGSSGSGSRTQSTLDRSEAQWNSRSVRSYRYRFQYVAFAPMQITAPVIIEVRDGAPVSVTPVDPNITIDRAFFEKYDTVEELFAAAEQALNSKPASLRAEYDSNLGYLKSLNVDQIALAADDEYSLSVTDFETLP
ncbi:MAG: hypothetical protein OHK0029_20710 [Armatimonadaceae bacterium]